jgi:PTH1 family peptidyl-tRNA hydrolase
MRAELKSEKRYRGRVAALEGRWLLEPETYMNESGRSVGALAGFYKIATEEILVAHDELDFLPGVAKLKLGGGVAGHNGLKSIATSLGTQDFWRLRLGIGHPGDRYLVGDYVLSKPSAADREAILSSIDRSLEIIPLCIAGDMEGAMLKLHTKPPKEKK